MNRRIRYGKEDLLQQMWKRTFTESGRISDDKEAVGVFFWCGSESLPVSYLRGMFCKNAQGIQDSGRMLGTDRNVIKELQ